MELSDGGVDERYPTLAPAKCTEPRLSARLQNPRPVCIRAGRVREGDAGQVHAGGRHVRQRFAIEIALHRRGQQPLGRRLCERSREQGHE